MQKYRLRPTQHLILIFCILFLANVQAIAGGSQCSAEDFKYSLEEVLTWDISIPVDQRSTKFPVVLYKIHDPLWGLIAGTGSKMLAYTGYIVLDRDWSAVFYPKGENQEFYDHALITEKFIAKYNASRPQSASFEDSKAYFKYYFFEQNYHLGSVYLMAAPGEGPDETFIPEFDPVVFQCSEDARRIAFLPFSRMYDKNLSIFRPTNLKPGMRVLLPVPPPDLDDRPE